VGMALKVINGTEDMLKGGDVNNKIKQPLGDPNFNYLFISKIGLQVENLLPEEISLA